MQQHELLSKQFEDFVNECEYIRGLRPTTIQGYRHIFNAFLSIMPEIETVQDLSTSALLEFFKRLHTRVRKVGDKEYQGVKASTSHTYAKKLNTFFKWLVARGFLNLSPLNDIKLEEPQYEDDRALTNDEIQKIEASILTNSSNLFIQKRNRAMLYVLTLCGIRKGELIGLRVQDIDMEHKLITVRKETSKSKSTRIIPMNFSLWLCLKDYLQERKNKNYTATSLFVSSQNDKGLTIHGMKHWVNSISRQSDVRFHLHRFRHTFACALEKQNVSATKIQKLMGHTDIKMTMKYLRSIHAEQLRPDINLLSLENLL